MFYSNSKGIFKNIMLLFVTSDLFFFSGDFPGGQVRPSLLCVSVLQWHVSGETSSETHVGSVQTADQVWRNFYKMWILYERRIHIDLTIGSVYVCRKSRLDSLDLNVPPPGLASFLDLYVALLTQYEAVSFGDWLFGCWVLLPLQRRYSATMRLAVFGEHVGMLRSLGVSLEKVRFFLFCCCDLLHQTLSINPVNSRL